MKCYYIASVNGKTVFEPREVPVPHPGKGELLVKVRAASLNRGEVLASISLHAVHEPKPAGIDCAGEVEAVGEGATTFKKGDRVMGRARGCFAEYVAMSVEQAARAPAPLLGPCFESPAPAPAHPSDARSPSAAPPHGCPSSSCAAGAGPPPSQWSAAPPLRSPLQERCR